MTMFGDILGCYNLGRGCYEYLMGKILQYTNAKYLGSIPNTQNAPSSYETLFTYFVSNTYW